MNRRPVLTLLIFGAAALAALTVALIFVHPAKGTGPDEFRVVTVDVNGRQVPCVAWVASGRSGISCDWED